MSTTQTAKEFAHVHLPSGRGVPEDEEAYKRYVLEKLEEAENSTEPHIPHEQVMARQWAILEKLVRKSA